MTPGQFITPAGSVITGTDNPGGSSPGNSNSTGSGRGDGLAKKPLSKTEATLELTPGKDDTIFIDQEGSFRQTTTRSVDD
jgi:hypothetical protein